MMCGTYPLVAAPQVDLDSVDKVRNEARFKFLTGGPRCGADGGTRDYGSERCTCEQPQ